MTKPNTIKIDEIEYIRTDQITVKPTKKQIVVLQRGWIVIGDVHKTDTEVQINNCSVIRVWGTSKGLGDIAENGPTGKTVLDSCPPVTVHPMTVVMYMNVDESKWDSK